MQLRILKQPRKPSGREPSQASMVSWIKALNINSYLVGIIPICEGHKTPFTLGQNYPLPVALEKS